jgi:hypothetical protein
MAMKVPTVEKFFCVFDLNLGGLIIGWFGAISNASLALLLVIDYLFYEDKFEEDAKEITGSAKKLSPGLELIDKVELSLSIINSTALPTEISSKHLSSKGLQKHFHCKILNFNRFCSFSAGYHDFRRDSKHLLHHFVVFHSRR